jgi:hypothetical protein
MKNNNIKENMGLRTLVGREREENTEKEERKYRDRVEYLKEK